MYALYDKRTNSTKKKELIMYAYAPDSPIELEIESGQSRSERPKYEILIISVSDVHIALGFVQGTLALLVASRTSQDARYEID